MFTVHLDSGVGTALCGAFLAQISSVVKNINCRDCLEARIQQINDEIHRLDQHKRDISRSN